MWALLLFSLAQAGLYEDIQEWREPATKSIGLEPHPKDHSTDNATLFNATYMSLLSEEDRDKEWPWWFGYVESVRISEGIFSRYPGETASTSHDDMTGLASVSPLHAIELYEYASEHQWSWQGNWLGRILDFPPSIKAAAGKRLDLWDQAKFSLALVGNVLEPRGETSGKCLLLLKIRSVQGKGKLSDWAIRLWKLRMASLYDSPRGLYSIYFGPSHPFSLYAPDHF